MIGLEIDKRLFNISRQSAPFLAFVGRVLSSPLIQYEIAIDEEILHRPGRQTTAIRFVTERNAVFSDPGILGYRTKDHELLAIDVFDITQKSRHCCQAVKSIRTQLLIEFVKSHRIESLKAVVEKVEFVISEWDYSGAVLAESGPEEEQGECSKNDG